MIAGKKAIVRSDRDETLAVIGTAYRPLQNVDAFDFFQPFVDQGLCTLETAGSLNQGKRIWVLAKLQKAPIEVSSNDIVEKYLLLSNSHDGTLAVRVGFTPIRVVCNNTMAFAHDSKSSKLIRVYHGSKVKQNVEALRDTIDAVNESFSATEEQMKLLKNAQINQEDLRKYIKASMKIPEKFESERARMRSETLEQRIMELFEVSPGAKEAGHTYWGAYNAVNYYLNYEHGRTQDTRLNNLWFGNLSRMNEHAFSTAVGMVRS
jgi:phage/plasmid-like protein (TIGR03299 family)